MRSTERPPLVQALVLGLIQGPAELLPISSSSHTALLPWLLRWRFAELDVERRRAFDVALHVGTAAALLWRGSSLLGGADVPTRPGARTLLLATAPPALAGYLFEGVIDRRLSGPPAMAAGLAAGAAAMAASERRAARRGRSAAGVRRIVDAKPLDGALLGMAQVLALVPGVSRSGATLAVARARGFGRGDSIVLSWRVGMPVIVGAGALKGYRAALGGKRVRMGRELITGAAGAFASTTVSLQAVSRQRLRPLAAGTAPYAAYRALLAALVIRRLIRGDGARGGTGG